MSARDSPSGAGMAHPGGALRQLPVIIGNSRWQKLLTRSETIQKGELYDYGRGGAASCLRPGGAVCFPAHRYPKPNAHAVDFEGVAVDHAGPPDQVTGQHQTGYARSIRIAIIEYGSWTGLIPHLAEWSLFVGRVHRA
jgi:hypothetical protein